MAAALGTTLATPAEKRIAGTIGAGAHRMSMLQDFERGRPLEYPVLRDSIVAMRELAGLETPMVDAMLALLELRARAAGLAA